MTLKKNIFSSSGTKLDVSTLRYESSKIVFLLVAFTFFLVYFLLTANIFTEFLSTIFYPLYSAFIVSLVIFLIFSSNKFLTSYLPRSVIYVVDVLIALLLSFILIPLF
ncbi:hypothetical protein GW846_01770 [Candidatus Gracilibacteria bacterium]|nr:hypothetical protein [Candidatus Gracilibacteria bacterium]